jgi:RNA polymerase sigma-70 factor (ECF subfamily)
MGTDSSPDLSQFPTDWSLVFQAHGGSAEQAASAQVALMDRYSAVVHRYLRIALDDRHAADELEQEFAVRFLRGDFHRANPELGRFRDFVKRSLHNLMIDYRRRNSARPRPLGDHLPEPVDTLSGDRDFNRRFTAAWRSELLSRAWDALARFQERTGQPYHTLLRYRTEHPELHSNELAEQLAATLGRPLSPGAFRMSLQRARDRFVEFLLEEVARTRATPSPADLEEELAELGLLEYCRPHLKRGGGRT